MEYTCNMCRYKTLDKRNFWKHRKRMHIDKKDQCDDNSYKSVLGAPNSTNLVQIGASNGTRTDFMCEICAKSFSRSYTLKRHQEDGRCKGKRGMVTEYKEILEQKKELEVKMMMMEYETKLKIKETELSAAERADKEKSAFIMSGKVGEKHYHNKMSVKTFIEMNYPNAPPLEELNLDKMLTLGDEEKGTELVNVLIYHHSDNRLAKYLGGFLVKNYRKTNPSEQSVWTSDTSRLTYVIRELLSNNKAIWNPDKKGVKTKESIIIPMLDHVKLQIGEYVRKYTKIANRSDDFNEQMKLYDNMNKAYQIEIDIDTGNLADNIIKYIAPYFHMDKSDIKDDENYDDNIGYVGPNRLIDH
jgi:hypothetical protein